MDWPALFSTLISPVGAVGVAAVGLLTYLFALGLYKLVKDWLPF